MGFVIDPAHPGRHVLDADADPDPTRSGSTTLFIIKKIL
jgi:hypothetical protein